MKSGSRFFHITFLVVAFLHLLSVLFQWNTLVFFSKPLLMASLGAWFFLQTRDDTRLFRWFILAGLLFSMAGDTFLMFVPRDPDFFLFGLGSFLITHLLYITGFTTFRSKQPGFVKQHPLVAAPVVIYLVAIAGILWKDLPSGLLLPVLVYSAVISTMLLSSIHMRGKVCREAADRLLSGALLFVISDSVIAIQKFKLSDATAPVLISLLIMTTYIAGQYLIASGSVVGLKSGDRT